MTTPLEHTGIKNIFAILTPVFRRHIKRLLLGFTALVCVDFIQLIIPKFIKQGVDSLAEQNATSGSLFQLALIIVGAACCVVVLRFIWRYLILGFSRILEKKVRDQIYEHILTMDQPFFERWKTGDIMARVSNDLGSVQMASGMGLVAAVDALVLTSVAICFMGAISIKLTLLALLPMPLLGLCTRVLSSRMHYHFNLVQEQFSLLTEFVRTTLSSIQLIQGYTLEKMQQKRFGKYGKDYVSRNLGVARIQGLLFPAATMFGNLCMLLILYYGGQLVVTETITIGDFAAFMTYMQMLTWPMMAFGWVANVMQRGITSLKRINTLLKEEQCVREGDEQQQSLDSVTYRVEHLYFSYPEATREVLIDISLEVGPGILGITGKTGSGKSTLCKLLLRLYQVPDQKLFFNDQEVHTLSTTWIRDHIAYVSQEPVLFSDTVVNNIGFGMDDPTETDIINAAQQAAIHEEILSLPDGYQTVIGERGVKLSGGQKQRLSLARALLLKRPLLIIDDGLSGVDVETEVAVLEGIKEVEATKIVLIVSHRINVLEAADQIIILDDGAIVGQGTHNTLLDHPFYRAMIDKQKNND
ncbi:MAG: multidrug ABC transporter ATP-binding protein [Desulfobulbus propionicus]|nr:MAG: multidrug ABC transporter ATP-binding protein [Desulfobulbus propionicus]